MSNPTVTAMADQTMMALAEAERLAPDNGQLHEHPVLASIIQDHMGRPVSDWAVETSLHCPQPVVVHPGIFDDHDYAPPAAKYADFKFPTPCTLCNTQARYKGMRRLWVSAGATIFELHFCQFHQLALEEEYGPIVWRE